MPHAEINVPGLILVGRFSGDPHWPVLGDPWGLRSPGAETCRRIAFNEVAWSDLVAYAVFRTSVTEVRKLPTEGTENIDAAAQYGKHHDNREQNRCRRTQWLV